MRVEVNFPLAPSGFTLATQPRTKHPRQQSQPPALPQLIHFHLVRSDELFDFLQVFLEVGIARFHAQSALSKERGEAVTTVYDGKRGKSEKTAAKL